MTYLSIFAGHSVYLTSVQYSLVLVQFGVCFFSLNEICLIDCARIHWQNGGVKYD